MKEGRREWINRSEVQVWAIGYLQRRKLRRSDQEPAEDIYNRLASLDRHLGGTNDDKKLLKQMRGAWNQKKFRGATSQKKPASFVLSHEFARAIKRLANDWGVTKTMALEQTISDALNRENAYKIAKKDEGVYKRRAEIISQHLRSTLDELYEYKALSDRSELNTEQRAAALKVARRASRERNNEFLAELPVLASRKKKKIKTRGGLIAEQSTNSSQIPSTLSKPPLES